MMTRSGAFPIGFLLLISACSSGHNPPPDRISFDNSSAIPPVVGTEIAGPDTMLQPLPTGVLLLTEPKDGAGFERNMEVCEAFFRTLPSSDHLRAVADFSGDESLAPTAVGGYEFQNLAGIRKLARWNRGASGSPTSQRSYESRLSGCDRIMDSEQRQ